MYEDLVRNLRICQDGEHCDRCEFYGLKMANGLNACTEELCKQAADAIEELQQTVAHYKGCSDDWHKEACDYKAMIPRWISVDERLPDCFYGEEIGNVEWIHHSTVYAGCFGRGGKLRDAYFRVWNDDTEGIDAKDAEYWRFVLLPEPPKEGTE